MFKSTPQNPEDLSFKISMAWQITDTCLQRQQNINWTLGGGWKTGTLKKKIFFFFPRSCK